MTPMKLARKLSLFSGPAVLIARGLLSAVAFLFLIESAGAQSLQVTYGDKGVQTIRFGNTLLEDVGQYGSDAFHIWHMRSRDMNGNLITSGQYGWGESNSGESWNASAKTETYTFSWGSITTEFLQNGNNLDMYVTETNRADSGIIFDGAEIFPFALHFPMDPVGFNGYTQYAITTIQPGVSVADFGTGVVTSVLVNESAAFYGGWKIQGTNTYSPIMTGTFPDYIPTFLPHNSLPLPPGQSLSYRVSLRFTPEGTVASAADAYAGFAAKYPSQMTWTDRRIIGTAYLGSSPSGLDVTKPGGFPTNPRRYFNDSSVDITTAAGLRAFQQRVITQARNDASNALALNAQGVITWDIEGEQYPQTTSYVCSPDQIATAAPEMESTISDSSSPYYGRKLDDAYFQIMSASGLRTGVCLRPQVFTPGANGTASQVYLYANADIIANLENKVRYASSRWGTTIFYVDSTVDTNGGTLDPAIFQQLITDFPAFLFIPEESTPRYYAYSAPFYTFIFHGDLGTPASVYNYYPNAFGANLVNDVAAATLSTYTPQLTASVRNGDILMAHADYWQENNPTLVAIYAAAGATNSRPTQVTPSITWSTPSAIQYGTVLSTTQLNALANTAGTFVYTPAAGTLLTAGATKLLATFTPSDTAHYTSATASVPLTVTQATPVIAWSAPGSVVAGMQLSTAQLNATASVPGSFTYTPSLGTVVNAGTTVLTANFTPSDATDYTSVGASVNLTVTPVAQTDPVINWLAPASIVYGATLSATQLNATANVPGTFSYSPGVGSTPGAGNNLLSVTFTPSDTTHYRTGSAVVNLSVARAVPVVSWAAPSALSYGTPLSSTQLNASASVPGTFVYTPAAGTTLPVGTSVLSVNFVPADAADYTSSTVGVPVTVNAVTAPAGPLALLYPQPGATLSGTIVASGRCSLPLDAAGTFLMVDGREIGTRRVFGPFVYDLDTTTLSNGPHVLQIWAHDIGNNTTLSPGISVNVEN